MRLGVLGFALCLLIAVIAPRPAHAKTISIEQEIIVQARVAAIHTIIVNDEAKIIEIISNTPDKAELRAYRNRTGKASKLPITEEITEQYDRIMVDRPVFVGTIYKYYQLPALSHQKTSSSIATSLVALL